ncbi:cation:H+ antiporter [Rhodoblastus acidophilus]|uniref:sodium:calcium antiporter n=1 Tax=Rhodoblastus acidophilus TaxID=1074 RepID=UPI002224D55B|nr:hypothetical protein [Rhodoblastus acidophilus]MCW2317495.1 cation:H+ antiporter [Rhodoblastus acidophilus]
MAVTLLLLVGSALVIYFSCELFVNAVEWLGHRLSVTQTATGTILAAFGTALPESVVTLVAVAFGDNPAQKDIGVGAALGGPLALSTLAYGVVGLILLGSRNPLVKKKTAVDADCVRLSHDQGWFMAIFLCSLLAGLLDFPGKAWLGFAFLGGYALYVWKELKTDGELHDCDGLEPLRFRPRDEQPSLFWAALQSGVALVVVFAASRIFVAQLDVIGPALGLPPQLAALLLSPVATEMPETLNAVIWVQQGKERLALANISGSMMIQATVPTAFGLFFTPWRFEGALILAASVTLLATAWLFLLFRRGKVGGAQLARSSLIYAVFAGALIFKAVPA